MSVSDEEVQVAEQHAIEQSQSAEDQTTDKHGVCERTIVLGLYQLQKRRELWKTAVSPAD